MIKHWLTSTLCATDVLARRAKTCRTFLMGSAIVATPHCVDQPHVSLDAEYFRTAALIIRNSWREEHYENMGLSRPQVLAWLDLMESHAGFGLAHLKTNAALS